MLIKRGSSGPHVRSFQSFLNDSGINVGAADGVAGAKTVNAIKALQLRGGLAADGIAGKKTLAFAKASGWNWGAPTRNQIKAANTLGLDVQVVQAIEQVESGGSASSIRFEPHVFLRKKPEYKGQIPYTPGPKVFSVVRGETDLAAFQHAYVIDPTTAVESASWGLYQVMGSHLLALYDGDHERAVVSFDTDPEAVSYDLFVRWFRRSPSALKAARERNWELLARHYNGPGQVAYYGKALKDAYAEFA